LSLKVENISSSTNQIYSCLLFPQGTWKQKYVKNSTYFAILMFEQSEADCKDRDGLKLGGTNRKGGLFGRTDKDVMDQEKDLRRWSSQHSAVEVSDCFASASVCCLFSSVYLHHIKMIETRNEMIA